MKRHLFKDREKEAKNAGMILDRDPQDGHPYCLWFNSPTGSKEIWIRNLADEFEMAFEELIGMKAQGD